MEIVPFNIVRVLKFWVNSIIYLKWPENRTVTLEVLFLLVIIKYWIWSFLSDNFFRCVIPMTSSISDSNKVCKTHEDVSRRRCLTPKMSHEDVSRRRCLFNFWFEEYFILSNTEKVISYFFPKCYRKVRKLSIWLKQGKMSPVDFDDLFRSVFRST